MQEQPNYAAYWAAALARHKARIAAGCISAVGAKRIGKAEKEEKDNDPSNAGSH